MISAGSLGVIYFLPDLVAYLSLTTSQCGSTETCVNTHFHMFFTICIPTFTCLSPVFVYHPCRD